MALIGINPARPRTEKDTLDRVAQGLDIAQGVLGIGLAIPEFIRKRKESGIDTRLKEAQIGKLEAESQPLTEEQKDLYRSGGLPEYLIPNTIGEAKGMVGAIQTQQRISQGERAQTFKEKKAAREAAEKKAAEEKGKELTPNLILKVNEGNVIPRTLSNINLLIENNKDLFSPVSGAARSINPYDPRAQSVEAELRAASQQFGRFMEGGVLRKEDEVKYRRMFPKLSDLKEVAQNKLNVINQLLRSKQESDLKALQIQGYDITGLELPPEERFVKGKKYKKVEGGWLEVGD